MLGQDTNLQPSCKRSTWTEKAWFARAWRPFLFSTSSYNHNCSSMFLIHVLALGTWLALEGVPSSCSCTSHFTLRLVLLLLSSAFEIIEPNILPAF